MKCDNCGSDDAVINLTQIENNEMTLCHLCEKCAAAKGLETEEEPINIPLSGFLAQIGGVGEEEEASPVLGDEACDFCGLTFADFKETGRLGCPHCYLTYEAHLRGLLRRVHGATQHTGKVYLPPDPTAAERFKRLEGLRRRLQRAVQAEDFERAATLRDEIRSLEPTTQS